MQILAFEVIVIDVSTAAFDGAAMAERLRELSAPRRVHMVALYGASSRHGDGPPRGFDTCMSRSQPEADVVAALSTPCGPLGCMCPKRTFAVVRGASI
jgi:hypothetical protein